MQLHLAFLELSDPPSPTAPTIVPPWEQIDEAARALEVLARLIASMLGAPEEVMPDE